MLLFTLTCESLLQSEISIHCTHIAMQHAHAHVEPYDGFYLQPNPPLFQVHHLQDFIHMHHLMSHVCDLTLRTRIIFTSCLAQLQDEGAVNVHHLSTPNRPLTISLQAILKDASCDKTSSTNTSLGLVLPALQAQAMAYMSRHKAIPDIGTPGGLATVAAVAGSLGLHATDVHTQVQYYYLLG